jgi:hypothetical protein
LFRLIKLLISLAALAGFIWFGANVQLGQRTLFGHLQAIGQTREAHELVEGTKESARPLVEEAGRRLAHRSDSAGTTKDEASSATAPSPGKPSPPEGRPPADEVTDSDKQALRKVIGSNTAARKPPRPVR